MGKIGQACYSTWIGLTGRAMRYLGQLIKEDLADKMVFLAGPRQVGKTTLAKAIAGSFDQPLYFNWDNTKDRRSILAERWQEANDLLIFDELHKYRRWKRWLKGIYDVEGERHGILVTGSARLDIYRRGGDSLLGRYHLWHLHPFSPSELPAGMSAEDGIRRLLRLGGFPEPFLKNNERAAARWRTEKFDRVLREDVRDLEEVRDLSLLSLFIDLLRSRACAPLVISNLSGELEIATKTGKSWLALAERMYLAFIVKPYTRAIARAIQKPPKVCFYDIGDVEGDDGVRFENLVACELFKRISHLKDAQGLRYELHYIRDKEGREVDFVIAKNREVHALVEAKLSDPAPSKSLIYYTEALKPRHAIQIVLNLDRPFRSKHGIHVVPAAWFLPKFSYDTVVTDVFPE